MSLSSEMKLILNERKSRHINDDDKIEESWSKIIQALSKNEENTIHYLENSCKDDIYWISEVFEDVSENLQSENFIQCLRKLDNKFPELDMTSDIDIAEDYVKKRLKSKLLSIRFLLVLTANDVAHTLKT